MEKNRKRWFGPLYILEGFLFAVGMQNKSFLLTTGAIFGAVGTTIADLNNKRLDIRDAKNAIKKQLEVG